VNISKIELENFRQYKGKIKMEFNTDAKKNIVVILGANGAGKSNLYNALTWCLYGIEEHSKYRAGALKRLNEGKREAMAKEEYAKVSVKIDFEGKAPLRVERTQQYVKTADGFVVESPDEHKVWFHQKGNWKSSVQPSATVNAMLPQGIRKFFFFDGERLDDFFKPGLEGKGKIEEAIHDVAGVDVVDKTIEHLGIVERRIAKNAGKSSPEIENIQKKMNDLQDEMDDRGKVISGKKEQASFLDVEIDNKNRTLKTFPVKKITEYQKNREDLEVDIKDLKDELDKKILTRIEKIVDNGPYVFAIEAYSKSRRLIDAETEKGHLPPQIRGSFVTELLEKGTCICGMDISHKGPHREKVKGYLEAAKWDKVDQAAGDLKWQFDARVSKVSSTSSELAEIGRKINAIEAKLEDKQMKVKEISEKLKNVDSEDIVRVERERIEFKKQSEKLKIDLAVLKSQQKEGKADMEKMREDLNKEMRKYQQLDLTRKKLEFATKALKLLRDIRDEYISEVREKISSNTDKYFKELIWKKKEYEEVSIGEEFDLRVINRFGSDVKLDLSAGERQVLALSFMAALKDITGYKAPVLIDTPMGRISKKPKDNIAECLPKYLKDTQLILLVTDSEYTTSVKEKLDKRTANRYKLSFNENTSSTKVVAM
jgi:DNA sulfur modification protein DndD